MRISIFQRQNQSTYKEEYKKIIKVLSSKCIFYENTSYNYFEFINSYLFHQWKYRGTYLDCYSYLESIGVFINHTNKIHEDSFFSFLEFLQNIQVLMESIKKYKSVTYSAKASSVLFHNIPLLLEEYGYEFFDIDDKVYLLKKDIGYNDLMDLVPNDLYDLLMSYHTISNNGIKMKRILLLKIYQLMGDEYKSYNPSIYMCIKTVVQKMGIQGDIDSKYKKLSHYKLRKYYDYCYKMMSYLIQSREIMKYREEIRSE